MKQIGKKIEEVLNEMDVKTIIRNEIISLIKEKNKYFDAWIKEELTKYIREQIDESLKNGS